MFLSDFKADHLFIDTGLIPGCRFYLLDTAFFSSDELIQKWYDRMSPVRKKKIDRYRRAEDKLLSLGAGLLLQSGLRDSGISVEEDHFPKVALRSAGKPYLPEYPEVCFNLSHSGTKVLAVFSSRPLGCDLQKITKADLKLAARFFHPSEHDWLLKCTSEVCPGDQSFTGQDLAFSRLWACKESFVKAVGCGIALPFSSFRIDPDRKSIFLTPDFYRELPEDAILPSENQPPLLYEFRTDDCCIAVCLLS